MITSCLAPSSPRSFFLYAGAGSGKTRSLVRAMKGFSATFGDDYRRLAKKIAVITYTNAAVDEIVGRIEMDPLFHVSTIHSFCWSLIRGFHEAIRTWLAGKLRSDLRELEADEAKGRPGTKASQTRLQDIRIIKMRLEFLEQPCRFTYNPAGDNFDEDSLSHDEVLKAAAYFISEKPSMQKIVVSSYPFLLIDESQDTNKHLMEAFLLLEQQYNKEFALGLFGDMMQRIYSDGIPNLGSRVGPKWAKPEKITNHRSARRIVELGNSLRVVVDGHRQKARKDQSEGFVRLFILPWQVADKVAKEQYICSQMAKICDDACWSGNNKSVKTLTLEHRMAASRGDFVSLFDSLDTDKKLSPGLRRGDLPGLRFFSNQVLPIYDFLRCGNKYGLMSHLRPISPLLSREAISADSNRDDPLLPARIAVEDMAKIDIESETTTFSAVLRCAAKHKLFSIPQPLYSIATSEQADLNNRSQKKSDPAVGDDEESTSSSPSSVIAWRELLDKPFIQIVKYSQYVSDAGPFGTHQGVKGREFDRVLVVVDDNDARGFMFSYEKLFRVKSTSERDRQQSQAGGETSVERTLRLLYVTCTRARKSLAVVAYTANPIICKQSILELGWFKESEITILNDS